MTKTVQIETTAAEPVSGIEIFVPLNKLKKSPKNARKVPQLLGRRLPLRWS